MLNYLIEVVAWLWADIRYKQNYTEHIDRKPVGELLLRLIASCEYPVL